MEEDVENICTKFPYLNHILQGYLNQQFDNSFKQSYTTFNNQRYKIIGSVNYLFHCITARLDNTNHDSLKSFLGATDENRFQDIINVAPLICLSMVVPIRRKGVSTKEAMAQGSINDGYASRFYEMSPEYIPDDDEVTLTIFASIYKDYLNWVTVNIINSGSWKDHLQEMIKVFKDVLSRFTSILDEVPIGELSESEVVHQYNLIFDPFDKVISFMLCKCSGIERKRLKNFDNKFLPQINKIVFSGISDAPISYSFTGKKYSKLTPDNFFNLTTTELTNQTSIIPIEIKAVFNEVSIENGGTVRSVNDLIVNNTTFRGITDQVLRYALFKGLGAGVLFFYNKLCLISIFFEVDLESLKLEGDNQIILDDLKIGNKPVRKKVPLKVRIFNMTSIDDTYISCFIKILVLMKQKIDLFTPSFKHKRTEISKLIKALIKSLVKIEDYDFTDENSNNRRRPNKKRSHDDDPIYKSSSQLKSGHERQTRSKTLRSTRRNDRRGGRAADQPRLQNKNLSLLISFEGETMLDYGIWTDYQNHLGDTLQKLGFHSPMIHAPRYLGLEYFKECKFLVFSTKVKNFEKYLIQNKMDTNDLKTYLEDNNLNIRDVFGSCDGIFMKIFNIGLHEQVYKRFKDHQERFDTSEEYIEYVYNSIYKKEVNLLNEIKEHNVSAIKEGNSEDIIPVPEVLLFGEKFNWYLSEWRFAGYLGFYFIMNEIEEDDTWENALPLAQNIIDEAKDNIERMIRVLNIRHNDIHLRNLVLSSRKVHFLDFGISYKIDEPDWIDEYVKEDRERLQNLLGNKYPEVDY